MVLQQAGDVGWRRGQASLLCSCLQGAYVLLDLSQGSQLPAGMRACQNRLDGHSLPALAPAGACNLRSNTISSPPLPTARAAAAVSALHLRPSQALDATSHSFVAALFLNMQAAATGG